MTRRRGVGLVEVVVALLIAAVAWGALLSWHRVVVRTLIDASLRDEARWTLQATADSLNRVGGPRFGGASHGWGRVEWAPAGAGVVYRALDHADDTVAVLWGGPAGPP